MLQSIRTGISSWSFRILLVALILSFVSFYGWRGGESLKPGIVATVDGYEISARDLEFRLQNLVAAYRSQGILPEDLSESLLSAFQSQVLQMLIDQQVKSNLAREMGWVPSRNMINESIRAQFSDSQGKFDFDFYQRFLRNRLGKNPGTFEKQQGDLQLAVELDQLLQSTSWMTERELRQTYELRNEKVQLAYLHLDPARLSKHLSPLGKPSQEDLEQFFQANLGKYELPEKRKFEVVWIEKEKPQDIDEAVRALAQFKEGLEAMSLEEAPKPSSAKFAQVGPVSIGDKISALPEERDSARLIREARDLEPGETSTPMRSLNGRIVYIVRLLEIEKPEQPKLESIKGQVVADLEIKRDAERLEGFAQKTLNEAQTSKRSLAEVSKRFGLKVERTEPFPRSANHQIPSLGMNETVMREAFSDLKSGAWISERIQFEGKLFLVALEKKISPDWDLLDQERDTLKSTLAGEMGRMRQEAWLKFGREQSDITRAKRM